MSRERKAPTGFIGNVPDRDEMDKGWQTPPEILEPAREYWGGRIPFDACTTPANPTGAAAFFAPPDDGLTLPWPDRVWLNPPYGRDMEAWCRRAMGEPGEVILLLSAARWEQAWWQAFLARVSFACFIRGRVAFVRPGTGERVGGNTYANFCAAMNLRDPERWVACFGKVGLCLRWSACNTPPTETAYSLWASRKVPEQRELFAREPENNSLDIR